METCFDNIERVDGERGEDAGGETCYYLDERGRKSVVGRLPIDRGIYSRHGLVLIEMLSEGGEPRESVDAGAQGRNEIRL